MIAAQVVGKDPSAWSKTVIVDKGTRDGVRQGAPVVIPRGLPAWLLRRRPGMPKCYC
jgi:rod shape-determining protein MreC